MPTRTFAELEAKRSELVAQRSALQAADPTDGREQQLARLDAGIENVDAERMRALEAGIAAGAVATEGERSTNLLTPTRIVQTPADEALRSLDGLSKAGLEIRPDVESVVRRDDLDARYVRAAGDPDYASAFSRIALDPATGHLRMTTAEQNAMQAVHAIEHERAMVGNVNASGGFAVPVAWDPSIILVGNGVANSIRQVATVRTMTTRELRLLTSAGVSASFDTEGTEVSDDSPTLGQPVLNAHLARAFIPFSFELGDDWANIAQQLGTVMQDARDTLESNKFAVGTGTGEPQGILAGLSVTQRVQTAVVATFSAGDMYLLRAALPARFQANASLLAAQATIDAAYRFGGGASTEPPVITNREGAPSFIGKPVAEYSELVSTVTTTGSKIAVYGDLKQAYTIGDRLGFSVEIVPHLFGANGRPTGQRGAYARWRVGALVVNPNAARYLEVK